MHIWKMGYISRKLFPACDRMCVCCPALRTSSRQPVKRYKKLVGQIFLKPLDGPSKERKIIKLCEYALKNPFRIPRIAKYLEERCYKELRHERIELINIVIEAYSKMLGMCRAQMAYFATSLLNVITELLKKSKQDVLLMLGCQTLTRFIYSQEDGTYMHNIEKFVDKACKLSKEMGDEHEKRCLRASGMQCLSAVLWFMGKFSCTFDSFDEIVRVTLDNYVVNARDEESDRYREESLNHWVGEVIRSKRRGPIICNDVGSRRLLRPRPKLKDPLLLIREEVESPRVWAQICVQRMAEFAKESTTVRQILDPMFLYFDSSHHWDSQKGLALVVLSDMCYLMEISGNQQLVLLAIIRHVDHKDVVHDAQMKSCVIQVASALARQIKYSSALAEVGFVSDLCRHLRKSFQAIFSAVGEDESVKNFSLQKSITDCLLEVANGMGDPQILFDIMVVTLEGLSSCGVVAHAAIGSLLILSNVISTSVCYCERKVFPEILLLQLLKAILHVDPKVRVGVHQIISVLLQPSYVAPHHEDDYLQPSYNYEHKRWLLDMSSPFASVTELLQKLLKMKNGYHEEKVRKTLDEDGRDYLVENNSSAPCKIRSMIKKTSAVNSPAEAANVPRAMIFCEDQISQLLSALWLQANISNNTPFDVESMSNSFNLALISSLMEKLKGNLVIRFFQLPLSLRNLSLDSENELLSPAHKRSIFTLSSCMLRFAAKTYQIHELNDLLQSLMPIVVDPFLAICDEHLCVKPEVHLKEYGSDTDNNLARSFLHDMQCSKIESDNLILEILKTKLLHLAEIEEGNLAGQLWEPFIADDALLFGPCVLLDVDNINGLYCSKESDALDEDVATNSLVLEDAACEASMMIASHSIPNPQMSPTASQVMGIGKLLESSLEVAGQVAGIHASSSPLSYDALSEHCEALRNGTRKKLSKWLIQENHRRGLASDITYTTFAKNGCIVPRKIVSNSDGFLEDAKLMDHRLTMRLPPASPFDNFLRAARCS